MIFVRLCTCLNYLLLIAFHLMMEGDVFLSLLVSVSEAKLVIKHFVVGPVVLVMCYIYCLCLNGYNTYTEGLNLWWKRMR